MSAPLDMTATEMNATKNRPAPLADCRIVGRTWYRWHEGRQEWFQLSPASVKSLLAQRDAQAAQEALDLKARTMPWQMFVCGYVAEKTAATTVQGYSARQVGDGDSWELLFMGTPQFKPMDARTLYSWFERLPLVTLSREADEIRLQAHLRAA
jgi:hypothetical protein